MGNLLERTDETETKTGTATDKQEAEQEMGSAPQTPAEFMYPSAPFQTPQTLNSAPSIRPCAAPGLGPLWPISEPHVPSAEIEKAPRPQLPHRVCTPAPLGRHTRRSRPCGLHSTGTSLARQARQDSARERAKGTRYGRKQRTEMQNRCR